MIQWKTRIRRLCALLLCAWLAAGAACAEQAEDPFRDFVMSGEYLSSGPAFHAEEPVAFILLFEPARNGHLLILSNGGSAGNADYYIYRADRENRISYACALGGPAQGMYCFPGQERYTGLFCGCTVQEDTGTEYRTYYLTLDGENVRKEYVSALSLTDGNGQVRRITEDTALFELSVRAEGRSEVQLYTKDYVMTRMRSGWNDLQEVSPGFSGVYRQMYNPEPTPEATATPETTATPEPTPEPTATPEPTPAPTETPEPTPEPTATPEPTPEPTATPEPTPEPTATPEPTPEPTPTPEPSAESAPTGRKIEYPVIGITTIKKVNVRVRPDVTSRRVTYLMNPGTRVTLTGETDTASGEKWYKVLLTDKQEGYVLAEVIRLETDNLQPDENGVYSTRFPFSAKTIIKKINLREKPEINGRRISYIVAKGTKVTVLDEVYDTEGNSWYRIELENEEQGYARSNLFEEISDDPNLRLIHAEEPTDDFTAVKAWIRIGRKEAAYSGPGEAFVRAANGKTYLDTTNDEIRVYGRDGSWVLVYFKVSSKANQYRFAYVPQGVFSEDSQIPELTFSRREATVTKKSVFTDDPFHSRSEIEKVREGDTVTYMGKMGDWAYIEAGNARGFISISSLEIQPEGE